jgi:hypothetical protein
MLKSKSLWGFSIRDQRAFTAVQRALVADTNGKNAAAFASVYHWQRRSGVRLHSCLFADRLPLPAANARPKQVQV